MTKNKLSIANIELAFQKDEKEKSAEELIIANKELAFQNIEKEKRAAELNIANIELAFQKDEKEKRAEELNIANIELAFQKDEKEKRAEELIIANKELVFQNEEKEKRATEKEKRAVELGIANKELAFQNKEKEKRAAELNMANKELAFQNKEKEKRAAELSVANKELAFQNKEKEKRAAELSIANIELAFQNDEKEKRAEELTIANIELAFQNKEKEKRAAEKEKRAVELGIANKELAFQNKEKEKRAAELRIANIELAFQNKEKEKRAAELRIANYARSLIEASLDLLVTISAAGKILDVNEASVKVTGVPREKLIGTDFSNYFTEPRKAQEGYLQVFEKGFVADYPLTIKHKNGNLTDVLYNASVYKDDKGNVLGVFAAARDVTEQKKSSQYARSLIEASLDPLVTISAAGKILDVNEASVKVTGVPREKLIGTDFSNYFTEPTKAQEGYLQVFEKGFVADYPLTIKHKNGNLTDVLYNASVYKDDKGNVLGVFAAARDITEQKKSSQYARSLIEASLDPLVTISAAGKILDVNEASVKVTGVPREKLIGTDFSNYFTEPTKAQEGYLQVFEKGFVADYPLTIKHKSGNLTDVLYNASVYKDDNGNVLGVFAAARDVTEQKWAKDLRIANKELVFQNEEKEKRSAELIIANKELESFTYISSHDLQEPLRQIQMFSSRIITDEQKNLSDKGKIYFEKINEAANRMQTLIADLLTYSRTTSTEKKFEITDINAIVEQVITEFKETIEEKHAILEVGEMCQAKIIHFQFLQLMHNLIGNSLKFSKPDIAPVIIIKSRIIKSSTINNQNLLPESDYCHITITDNGIGFEPQFKYHIFEVFKRLHDKEKIEGTGIGLAIVKKIIENHNGVITATSELNKGATFDIYIPAT